MKKYLALFALASMVPLAADAQVLLYQWAFTNSADTFASSAPSYAATPGTAQLNMVNVTGNAIGTTGLDGLNPVAYFTNSNAGPGAGPGVDAMGAYVANGQGYSTGNNAIAIATNLNLGNMSQITVTFWMKMGSTVGASQFPRFVQFYQTPAYDVGGKGSGNHNGLGTSINGWSGGIASQEQNGIANASSGQQSAVTISGNPALAPGFQTDGTTWYFDAITYDGTQTVNNFTTWIGTLTTNVQPFVLTANYGSINLTTNATVMIGGNDQATASRALSMGAIADVRIYNGLLSSNQLEIVRNFGLLTNHSTNTPPSITTQPVSGKSFAGGSRTFSVVAAATPPAMTYLWRSNGIAISGGTNASLTLNSLTATANGATFVCSITNFDGNTRVGGTNSQTAILSVVTPASGGYAEAVFTNNPYSFWVINEPSNTTTISISDYANGHDGLAMIPTNNLFVGGPASPLYPGFSVTNSGIETLPNRHCELDMANPGNFPNTGMTICGWVNTPVLLNGNGLIFDLVSDTSGGFGLQAGANDGLRNQLNYQWGNTSVASGLYFNTNEWTFIALTITTNLTQADLDNSIMADTNVIVYVGAHSLNGLQAITNSTALNGISMPSGVSSSVLALGRTTVAFSENSATPSAVNTAKFNSVAVFYHTLSFNTVSNLYLTGAGIAQPTITSMPDSNIPGNLLLSWDFGVLQESTVASGPYTDVAGQPSSPYSVPMTGFQHYYRVRQ